jgi:hypothetical protein
MEQGDEKRRPKERAPERDKVRDFLAQLAILLSVVMKLQRIGGFGISDEDDGSVGKEFERAKTLIFGAGSFGGGEPVSVV